jgi:protein CpxP
MKIFKPARPAIAAALVCAGVWAGGALAQQQPSAPPAGLHGPRDPMAMRQHWQEKRASHLKALHDALNIRPNQESAFAAFAAAMSPPPGAGGRDGHKADRSATAQALTTPQRLDQMAQRMDARTTRMKQAFERRAAATKALYAALNPDQQHTMDALHHLMGHDGMRRGGRGEHGGHGAGGPAQG